MKHTKIVATVGPVSNSSEMLEKLALSGVNVFRLNFSHGTHQWHGEIIKRIQRLNKKLPQNLAIMLDTKGPEIRTGDLKNPIELKKGQELILTVSHHFDPKKKVSVSYDNFIHDVDEGERILVDNGVMNLKVLKKTETDIICEVLDGGLLGSRRHLNLPMKEVSLDPITKKDWEDIQFGMEMGVDFIALSFVRNGKEIQELKQYLKKHKSRIEVIAKVESYEATQHLESVIEASDGVMVARGDLGAEVPFSHVPQLQREMIDIAGRMHKPVIVATHMLESMIKNPMPTRAEVTDIATAVWQRSDAVMLSGETAGGEHPIRSVEAMAEIAIETEKNFLSTRPYRKIPVSSDHGKFCKMAAQMAEDDADIEGILVITRSGFTAKVMSGFRPRVSIFAFTNVPSARRKLQLLWGVEAFRIDFSSEPEKTIARANHTFLEYHPEWKGKKYVLVSDSLVGEEFIPTLQIREFEVEKA